MTSEKTSNTIEYTSDGTMKFNPEFHHNHGKRFTEEELEYLCKFYQADGAKVISLALGRTEKVVATKVSSLRKKKRADGSQTTMFEYYKNLNKYW